MNHQLDHLKSCVEKHQCSIILQETVTLLTVHSSIRSCNGGKFSTAKAWREQTFSVALMAFSASNSGEDVARMKIRAKSMLDTSPWKAMQLPLV